MLRTIYKKVEKTLKNKLDKSVIKEKLLKHPNYIEKAKETFTLINKDLGISDKVENQLKAKMQIIEKFEKALLEKFPELTKEAVVQLRENAVKEVEEVKDIVLSEKDNLKQLQDSNVKLQEENAELKKELSKLQSLITSEANETSNTIINEESK